jgi:murein L,D-transpeptidase YcbB/YkuD
MSMRLRGRWRYWLAALLLGSGAAGPAMGSTDHCRQVLRETIASGRLPRLPHFEFSDLRPQVETLYRGRTFGTLWSLDGVPTHPSLVLTAALEEARAKGLDPGDYGAALFRSWFGGQPGAPRRSDCEASLLDLALTVSAMRYIADLRSGRVDPKRLDMHLDVGPKRLPLEEFVAELARSADPEALLARAEPPFRRYRALLQALDRYRRLMEDPELSRPLALPERSLRPGDAYPDLPRLMYKLRRLGDLPRGTAVGRSTGIYTEELSEAVRRFQRRHGLQDDGVAGKATFAELNVPMGERVRQIVLTLERWRWMPDDLGHRPVVINLPEYRLYAFEADGRRGYRLDLEMDVIVGEAYRRHQTPVFRGRLRQVVFAPYWNVPYSILRRELYPKIEADSDYLTRNQFEIVERFDPGALALEVNPDNVARLLSGELKLRQRPGPQNALGVAKFLFPNDHAVYLHGTPAKRLFDKSRRDFSHGCIRLADAPHFAAHVLRQEPDWDRARVDALVAQGEWQRVDLSNPLDVYILYATAVADPDGTVRFFRDIYGHDERLAQVMVASR